MPSAFWLRFLPHSQGNIFIFIAFFDETFSESKMNKYFLYLIYNLKLKSISIFKGKFGFNGTKTKV